MYPVEGRSPGPVAKAGRRWGNFKNEVKPSEFVTFGKYKGRTFADVLHNDPGYAKWCATVEDATLPMRRFAKFAEECGVVVPPATPEAWKTRGARRVSTVRVLDPQCAPMQHAMLTPRADTAVPPAAWPDGVAKHYYRPTPSEHCKDTIALQPSRHPPLVALAATPASTPPLARAGLGSPAVGTEFAIVNPGMAPCGGERPQTTPLQTTNGAGDLASASVAVTTSVQGCVVPAVGSLSTFSRAPAPGGGAIGVLAGPFGAGHHSTGRAAKDFDACGDGASDDDWDAALAAAVLPFVEGQSAAPPDLDRDSATAELSHIGACATVSGVGASSPSAWTSQQLFDHCAYKPSQASSLPAQAFSFAGPLTHTPPAKRIRLEPVDVSSQQTAPGDVPGLSVTDMSALTRMAPGLEDRDVLGGFEGSLEVELLSGAEFLLAAGPTLPESGSLAIGRWPGASCCGGASARGCRWRFPAAAYPMVCQRLRTLSSAARAGARCRIVLPPPWVLAVIPPFQSHGQAAVAKKTAYALRGDAPTRPLPEDVRSRDGLQLLPYQREGVEFGLRHGGRVLLADEMGLGKTAQALIIASQYPEDWPLLVVCPSSLRGVWREEATRWLPPERLAEPEVEIQVIRKGSDTLRQEAKIVIASYDLVSKHTHLWAAASGSEFRAIVCDEAHYLKSPSTQRSGAVSPLLQKARRCILLSGTPALGRAAELYVPMSSLLPGLLPSFDNFCERYCEQQSVHTGSRRPINRWVGSRLRSELNALLSSTVMVRRLKRDVLSQLPAKRRQRVVLEADRLDAAVARELKSSMREAGTVATAEEFNCRDQEGGEPAAAATELFRMTGLAKLTAAREYVEYLVQADCRFLLFAHHHAVLDGLEDALRKQRILYVRIDGSTPGARREELVQKFRECDTVQVALLSITACGHGLNLQCCSTVVFAELHWTPGVLIQAEDRVHRVGQRNSVNIHYLIAPDTLDDAIYSLLEKKHRDVCALLDGEAAALGAHRATGRVGRFSTAGGVDICNEGRDGGSVRGSRTPRQHGSR